VKHFAEGQFVHPSALFAPPLETVTTWVGRFSGDTKKPVVVRATSAKGGIGCLGVASINPMNW